MRTITLNIDVNNLTTDENLLRHQIICDDEAHVERRVRQAIEWYGKQGFAIRWAASEYWVTIMRGEWGYEGDDWAEPPTVGDEVI